MLYGQAVAAAIALVSTGNVEDREAVVITFASAPGNYHAMTRQDWLSKPLAPHKVAAEIKADASRAGYENGRGHFATHIVLVEYPH